MPQYDALVGKLTPGKWFTRQEIQQMFDQPTRRTDYWVYQIIHNTEIDTTADRGTSGKGAINRLMLLSDNRGKRPDTLHNPAAWPIPKSLRRRLEYVT